MQLVRTHREGGHLQPKEGLHQNPTMHPDSRLPAFPTVRNPFSLFKPLVYGLCYGSPS